jgi:hypothetical protein
VLKWISACGMAEDFIRWRKKEITTNGLFSKNIFKTMRI